MQSAASSSRPVRSRLASLSWVPFLSLFCLVLSRTALRHTRFEEGALGFGTGTLFACVLAHAASRFFPDLLQPKQPEDSDLQTLHLSR